MHSKKHFRPTIGVLAGWQVFTGIPDSFLGHVFRGIQAAAHDRNCNLLMACGIDSGRPAWPLLSTEVDFVPVGPWNTDGLIIVSPFASEAGERYAQDLIASGFPAIFAGDRDTGPAVVADNVGGIRQALEHLVKHGHHQIAFVAGRQSEHSDSGARLRAFETELRSLGLHSNPALIAYGSHNYEGGHQAIQQIINQGEKFTAVLASNDRSAIGVLDGLRQNGFVVPQDIALIGFDDRLESRALVPSLTTVHYPMFGLGYQAVELLLKAIKGESVVNKLVRIPTRLVIRESCGCLPGIPASIKDAAIKKETPRELTREQVVSQLTRVMTAAVHNEALWLSQKEVSYLVQRMVEAFLLSLEQNDPLTFQLMIKQILERVSARGDDLFGWQTAVTILRDHLPLIRRVITMPFPDPQEEEMLHQVRVAISDAARGRSTRSLLHQAREADQVGLMTSKFFAAHDECEIFDVLSEDLPAVGIQGATVGYYEAEADDPVAWGVLQTPGTSTAGGPCLPAGTRFPSRQFPPEALYPAGQAYQLAILPLKIHNELSGFVAFHASNLDPCADIVRQLGAAVWGVRLYREAVDARRLAEEANRLKSRFLSMVSHELRTPLNLITGLSKLLLDERPGAISQESLKKDLHRIFVSAQHLDGLIRDVLDLANSDMGQLKLVCEPLDMSEVVEAVSVIGEQLAHDKGLRWRVEIAKTPHRVWGDRTRLRQVLLNLVSNAVKFTTHGEISLIVCLENGQVMVSVDDTGLGIPLHEQSVIFDEFRQSERTTARGYGGLGLGLAICRKLVELHGGEVGVFSSGKEGEGSKFFFSLPVIEQQMDVSAKVVPLPEAQWVLLLVKDAKGGVLLQKDLIRRGYEVELYVVVEESDWLASLLVAVPDVVVLDLGLTSERGWEILKILKENPATKDIPVLFYSIMGDSDYGSFLEIDYLTKPVGSTALTDVLVSKGFFSSEASRDAERAILVVDDEPDMLELHARIVKAHLPGHRVLLARDGRQALQVINREHPALVLLDLMMPVLDGFEVLEEMRKTDSTRNIPVVVITGQSLTKEDMSRLNSGVASVLGKGMFSVEETLQHLAEALAHKRKPGSESQHIALKAMAYMHAFYAEPISRRDVAAHVGLSERHLTRCFHQEVGLTPITYLNRYRVKQAKALLDLGEKGITEVALEVGFSSSSYFTRVFRDEVGVSPRDYLRNDRVAQVDPISQKNG
jgi:signal transduction histidine kinase/DNA-binding LacI/PurR family transcriptional regulator/CheY-like chemotaxis protein